MRRTRYMSLILLALSLAFFFVRDFRWALQVPIWEWRYDRFMQRFMRFEGPEEPLPVLAEKEFLQLEQDAQRGDTSALAFLALHRQHASFEQKASWAEQAVQRDPRLIWLYDFVALEFSDQWSDPRVAARVEGWIAHLETSDAGNSVPGLLRAHLIETRTPDWPKSLDWRKDADQEYLLKQKEWTAAMDRVFHASRYDDYLLSAFLLERQVLSPRGWATPGAFVAISTSLRLPGVLSARTYANLQALYLARKDERAGRINQAIQRYYLVSSFALVLRQSDEIFPRLVGLALQKVAAPPMKAALEKAGRQEEAAALVIRMQDDPVKDLKNPLGHTVLPLWLTLLVHVFASAVVLAAALTALSLAYVNAKRWIRPQHQGPLFRYMTTLENYAPLLLFAACLGLYLAYTPYAQNFHYYMTATGDLRQSDAMASNMFPFFSHASNSLLAIPLQNPFRGYFYWALGLVAAASLLAYWDRKRLAG